MDDDETDPPQPRNRYPFPVDQWIRERGYVVEARFRNGLVWWRNRETGKVRNQVDVLFWEGWQE